MFKNINIKKLKELCVNGMIFVTPLALINESTCEIADVSVDSFYVSELANNSANLNVIYSDDTLEYDDLLSSNGINSFGRNLEVGDEFIDFRKTIKLSEDIKLFSICDYDESLLETEFVFNNEISDEEKYINYYSSVYHLNSDIVYDILSQMTDNFTTDNYINNNVIGESKMKNLYVDCDSVELAIMIAVRNINYNYGSYGYSFESIKEVTEVSELNHMDMIGKFSDVIGVDPNLAYAISRCETGFSSDLFKYANNPAGIRLEGSKFTTFKTLEAGYIELCLELLKYNMNGKTTIAEIGKSYAPVSDGNHGWVTVVSNIYNESVIEGYFDKDLENDEVVSLSK